MAWMDAAKTATGKHPVAVCRARRRRAYPNSGCELWWRKMVDYDHFENWEAAFDGGSENLPGNEPGGSSLQPASEANSSVDDVGKDGSLPLIALGDEAIRWTWGRVRYARAYALGAYAYSARNGG